MSERESILKGLNAQQRRAAEAVDGAWLVVAGAGSGKTTVLARRTAALVAAGIDPTSILSLSFTRAAARNLLERSRRLCPQAVDVVGGTFHSIGHRLVVENHGMFRLPEKPTILDPDDVAAAFRKLVSARGPRNDNLPKAGAIARVHSFSVNTKRPLAELVPEKMAQFQHAEDFVTEVCEAYTAFKRKRGLLDYDDLLRAWDRMLDVPAVAEGLRRRFRYVMVDEHQDSNAIQCSIVEKLGGDAPNVMVVGDPAQSIYAFRGAAPRTMFSFVERWPNAEVVKLEINYRSSPEILAVANRVDRAMVERFDRTLSAAPGAAGSRPTLVTVPGLDEEAAFVADTVLAEKADGVDLSDQAVLVRSMSAARHVEAELIARQIPYRVVGGIKISEAAHVKDLMCLSRVAVNVLDEPAWMRVLTMARGVGDRKAASVYDEITGSDGGRRDPAKVLTRNAGKHPDLEALVRAYRHLAAGGPPVEALERATDALEQLFLGRYDDWAQRKNDMAAVIGLAEGQDTLDAFLSAVTIDHSVDRKAEVTGREDSESPLTISTVHSAKGLEWDVVIVPSFVAGHIPSFYARGADEIEEEKRVLYVAVTRPKRRLVLVKPAIVRQGVLGGETMFERLVARDLDQVRSGAMARHKSLDLGVDAVVDIF